MSEHQPTQRGGELVERLRAAYRKVAEWPENRMPGVDITTLGEGFMDLLALRNLVEELLAADAISTLEAERDEARAEIERLRDCLRYRPNTMLIAYEDGAHERLSRAAAKANERAESAEATVERLREGLIIREARRQEILDWLQEQIGTSYECERCHYSTYHAFANECADCGEPFPLANLIAFKLHATGTESVEHLAAAHTLLQEPSNG